MDVSRETLERTYSGESDDALLDLHAAGHLVDLAYEVLEEQLTKRGLAVPPRPEAAPEEDEAATTIRDFWEGKASLQQAYWGVGVFGGLLAFVVVLVVTFGLALITQSEWVLVVPDAIWIAWATFAFVSIWRCAWNTRHKGWGYAARAMVVVGVLRTLAELMSAVADLNG